MPSPPTAYGHWGQILPKVTVHKSLVIKVSNITLKLVSAEGANYWHLETIVYYYLYYLHDSLKYIVLSTHDCNQHRMAVVDAKLFYRNIYLYKMNYNYIQVTNNSLLYLIYPLTVSTAITLRSRCANLTLALCVSNCLNRTRFWEVSKTYEDF